jgi:putative ABC transport system ATP-binding protein
MLEEMGMALIELEHVSKRYEKTPGQVVHALRDVSLRIDEGEWVAIVGASGSGKSTLMNVLGLLDTPDAGTYRLGGREVSGMTPREQARVRNAEVGFVFQSFHLLPRVSALENVELPLVYSDRPDIAGLGRRALELVGLGARLSHEPSELSGGQQQRVAIARALVNQPRLLLADEPTGNLDSASATDILSLFDELHRRGRTIVLVTHDNAIASRCPRCVRLADGVVIDDRVQSPELRLEEVR